MTDQYFTKIQLILTKIRYVLDYDQRQAPMTVNKARLMGIINKEGLQYQDVSENTPTKQGQCYLTNDMKLKKYSYILASNQLLVLGMLFSMKRKISKPMKTVKT